MKKRAKEFKPSTYRAEFVLTGLGCGERPLYVRAESLADLKDGFWINADHKFTKISDCKYWIPPHQIKIIVKESLK